jgi:hypothetical protein
MEHTEGILMPMDPNVNLDFEAEQGEKKLEDITDYQAVMWLLMYTALATRPVSLYAVAALSHYTLRPFTSNMTAATRVLPYLKSTADFRLHFNLNGIDIRISNGIGISNGISISNGIGISNGISISICINNSLLGYSDSDWANDSADCKSQGRYLFLASNGGAVYWQSRKQDLITMSTLEAEFFACLEAYSQAKSLLQLQTDIHGKDIPPLPINCVSQWALALITTEIIRNCTKHINVCYHISRDLQKRRIVNKFHIHTDDNVADIFTKALCKDKHTKFRKSSGL